jgi:alpha-L-fucosidase
MAGNVLPAEVCDTLQTGARWFWHDVTQPDGLQTADAVVARLKACRDRNTNYLLNVPPDRNGLIGGPQLKRLREIGALLRTAAAGS